VENVSGTLTKPVKERKMKMELQNPYLKDVMSYIEKNVAPTPAAFDEVAVTVDCESKVLSTYVDELYSNIVMAVSMKGGDFPISFDDFKKYINTIIKSRVDYVNYPGNGKRSIFSPTERFVVPSYLSCVLSNVGRARHVDYGIELYPKFIGNVEVFEDKASAMRVSNALKIIKGIGFEYAEGFTRSKEGSFDFMTMTLMEGIVRNISKDPHPVFALLSSTLNVKGVETVLSPRISYGREEHLANLVRGLAVLKV